MYELAQKLMNLSSQGERSSLPSVIFGTASSLSRSLADRPPIRIGLWPCKSDTEPQVAMGLMAALALLLERWQSIRVYRLFAQLEGEANDYTWDISRSQFDVDDWQLEGLDENVAVWGRLEKGESGWKLALEIENDLLDDEETTTTLVYEAESLPVLVNSLQNVANDIAAELNLFGKVEGVLDEDSSALDEAGLRLLLPALFEWNLWLVLALWGTPESAPKAEEALTTLIEVAKGMQSNIAGWTAAGAVGHTLQIGYGQLAESLLATAADVPDQFPQSQLAPSMVAVGLFRMGETQAAYDLLESDVETKPANVHSWLSLAELYLRGGKLTESLDTFQRAIEQDAINATLFVRYANLLLALDTQQWNVTDFILIDPDEYDENRTLWEAIEAFEEALALEPERKDILQQQLLRLNDVGDEARLWQGFARLVELDKEGDLVRAVADNVFDAEDITPAVEALKTQIALEPQRVDLRVNLAVMYLTAEEGELAAESLEAARELTDEADVLADIDRLTLAADDPDFEAHLAELTTIIEAGNTLSVEDVEYLEDILEAVPTFTEGYVLVAQAYMAWGEDDTALEVLLDGNKFIPNAPEITLLLAQLLWDAQQPALAFDYLEKALKAHPNNVPLLARTGQLLFENNQEEDARAYLMKAENLLPSHPALAEARAEIARIIRSRDS
ncbi:MAG: tetratricopeptide repeat protein [bacterium]|nr:tetratricopeptide repeat protein [bacterium]